MLGGGGGEAYLGRWGIRCLNPVFRFSVGGEFCLWRSVIFSLSINLSVYLLIWFCLFVCLSVSLSEYFIFVVLFIEVTLSYFHITLFCLSFSFSVSPFFFSPFLSLFLSDYVFRSFHIYTHTYTQIHTQYRHTYVFIHSFPCLSLLRCLHACFLQACCRSAPYLAFRHKIYHFLPTFIF